MLHDCPRCGMQCECDGDGFCIDDDVQPCWHLCEDEPEEEEGE